jgi:hypothetical protein
MEPHKITTMLQNVKESTVWIYLHMYYMIFEVCRVLGRTDRHSENIQDHAKDIPPSNYINENVKTQKEKSYRRLKNWSSEGYLKQLIEY